MTHRQVDGVVNGTTSIKLNITFRWNWFSPISFDFNLKMEINRKATENDKEDKKKDRKNIVNERG